VLVGLELTQALGGVQRAVERDGQFVAICVPAFGGYEEPGGVGVAAPDGSVQAPARSASRDEPQPELVAVRCTRPSLSSTHARPGLRQDVDRLVDEPVARHS
jgi:hypothetical protein